MVFYHKICKMPLKIKKIPKEDENRPQRTKMRGGRVVFFQGEAHLLLSTMSASTFL